MSQEAKKVTRLDLHVHTRGSDGYGTPEEIASQAVERGLDGLVLTDHHKTHTVEGLRVAAACRAAGLRVFRGCEYSSEGGHLLIYGVDVEELELGRYDPAQEVIDKVRGAGGVVVPSHPYAGYKRKFGDRVLALQGISGVESLNGQNAVRRPWANKDAVKVANQYGLGTTGGSDAHNPDYVGCCYTVFAGDIKNEADLVEAINAGHCAAVVNEDAVADLRALRKRHAAEKAREAAWFQAPMWSDKDIERYAPRKKGKHGGKKRKAAQPRSASDSRASGLWW